ncbi:tetratricopeptide repeat protein [Pseudothioglobus sp. nBUS_23]|uniref:tetratricopeptide repeat protein n=1 Tax=Pseudothioglobus sp. nBUS_23 TaxID=3395318 RepID=UPI003EBFB333
MMKKLVLVILTILSLGVHADLKRAIAFDQAGEYEKAAKELFKISQLATRGHPRAMYEFGTMYMKEGMWVVQSDEAGFDWWMKSANLGYAPAQFSIGASYIGGIGVNRDLIEAKKWLEKAINSTYEKYSKVAKELYTLNELDKI